MAIKNQTFAPDSVLAKLYSIRDMANRDGRQVSACLPADELLKTVLKGQMELEGLMPWSSNYTFLVNLALENKDPLLAIYKPGDGERPLWDFPERTLAHREFISYLVSLILGWPSIPLTILREGPHGLGSVQYFVEAEYEAHYFNMRDVPAFAEDFRRMALFDYIINNADRKGGHCLKGQDGKIWAIDHGLTFHTDPKLRTVIWEFCDDPIPSALLEDLTHLQNLLKNAELVQILADSITLAEIRAFQKRINMLTSSGQFPRLGSGRNVPFPPI